MYNKGTKFLQIFLAHKGMPQTDGYYDICLSIPYCMSTVIQYKHDQSPKQSVSQVGSDAKNALPTRMTAMDMIGLTWVFQDEESCLKSLTVKLSLIGK